MRVSLRALRIAATTVAVLAVAAATLGYTVLSRTIDLSQLDRIQRRNQLLAEELEVARGTLSELRDTVSFLASRDRQVRLLAGLNPTDPDVLMAGVGGPAGSWTEREQTLSEGPVGRRALALRRDLNDMVRQASLLAGSFAQAVESLQVHTDRLKRTPSIWPIAAGVGFLSSPFAASRLHPIFHEARPHEGIDVSAPMGTPILAPASGRVVDTKTGAGYGKTVTIDHGYGVTTRFAHCSKILVRVGQWVSRGDKIAEVGNSGITTAPHLHYEVLLNGRAVDPRSFIFRSSIVD